MNDLQKAFAYLSPAEDESLQEFDPCDFEHEMDSSLAALESIIPPLPRYAAYPENQDFALSDCASRMIFARIGGAPYSFSQASWEECCAGLGAEDIFLDF